MVFPVGNFLLPAGRPVAKTAKWNGETWSVLGNFPGTVLAMAASGSDVYATDDYVRKLNGSEGVVLGDGLPSVRTLAVSGSNVFAGGEFRLIHDTNGLAANYL